MHMACRVRLRVPSPQYLGSNQSLGDLVACKPLNKSEKLRVAELEPSVSVAVIEGMDIVYKVEKVGSQSGKTTKKVMIADAGEISL